MLFVISPSKTQTTQAPLQGRYSLPLFPEQTEQLVHLLRGLSEDALADLMKMSARLAAINYQRYQKMQFPFTPANSHQALFMFQGEQFNPLAVHEYSDRQLDHAQQHLAVLSGLYGLIRPLDLIQPYRLEMGIKLAVGQAKNLYQFWSQLVTRAINNRLQDDPQPLLVNLASAEYYKVVARKDLQVPVLTLSFKQNKGGKLKTIAIYAKRARGAMVHYMISEQIVQPEDLQAFTADGYGFAADLSTEQEWVFVRTLD